MAKISFDWLIYNSCCSLFKEMRHILCKWDTFLRGGEDVLIIKGE